MTTFDVHTAESAPAAAQPILQQSQAAYGFVPNLFGMFAESPALLEGYTSLGRIFDESTSLTPTERQIVLMTTSFENGCEYCMSAHSAIAAMQKVPQDVVVGLRTGAPLADGRLEALRGFTRKVVAGRGWVEEADLEALLDAGYPKQAALDVILGVSMKTLSNYANHLAKPPLDEAFKPVAWVSMANPSPAASA